MASLRHALCTAASRISYESPFVACRSACCLPITIINKIVHETGNAERISACEYNRIFSLPALGCLFPLASLFNIAKFFSMRLTSR